MSIIDLGDDFSPATEPPRHRKRSAGQRRITRIVALIVLVALLAAGSARIPGMPLAVVARIPAEPGATLLVAGSQAVVVEIRDATNRISAYGLDDGVRHWTTLLTVLAADVDVETLDGIVLVSFISAGVTGDHTDAVDLGTGAMLWHSEGALRMMLPTSRAAVLSWQPEPGIDQLELVDLASGAARWSAAVNDDCTAVTSSDASEVLTVGLVEMCPGAGELRVRDLRTGRIRVSRQVELGLSPRLVTANQLGAPQLWVFADVVLIGRSHSPIPLLDAYRANDLTTMWSGKPFANDMSLDACGADICLTDGTVSVVLDPLTGHARHPSVDPGANPVTGPGDPAGGSVLVNGRSVFVLLPAYAKPDRHGVFPTADFVATVADQTAVRIPDAAAGDTWVATRTITDGSPGPRLVVTPIELLHGIRADSCLMLAGYLVCATRSNRLTFWQLPSAESAGVR